MAKKQSSKPWDVTSDGVASYRQLQQENARQFQGGAKDLGLPSFRTTLPSALEYDYEGEEQSPLMQQLTQTGGRDYLGNSIWDAQEITSDQLNRLSDIRAENQPWYSKLVNGVGKAGVLAGTTALETLGLLYGIGQGIYDAANAEDGKGGEAFLHGLWDNPITNALQHINEVSEEYMPNYYTQDEQENPWGNIFTANFLGDKLLKNLGFMVGAFYGGIPVSKALGALGVRGVKAARAASLAERQGMAARVGELTSQFGDDAVGLERALAREGLTEAERGKKILEGFNKVKDAARTTRATTQTIGALGSAINEGAIEALNNSKDWAKLATQQEDARYQAELEEELGKIEDAFGGTEIAEGAKIQKAMELAEKHQRALAEIEEGRARMGNADLLLNIPVLMASNMYQLGKLYTRGFDSTRRQLGSLFNGHKLSGDLAKGTLKSDKTWKDALTSAILKSNTEGLEEYLQRAASDGAGQAVNDSIQRWLNAGTSGEATNNVEDFVAGFGKAIADNLDDPNAWEEYMIGAVSSMLGMPVFGSQTKNSYIGKDNGIFGFAGGIVGNYQDYMDAKKHEEDIANYLNQRVKDPKFKALYDNLKKQDDYDKWLQNALENKDKQEYKDLEVEKFYQDLNAAASAGHLEEFKQMVGYNTEYSDEELEDIVKQTSKKITPEQQRKQDEDRLAYLQGQRDEIYAKQGAMTPQDEQVLNELQEVSARIAQDDASKTNNSVESPYKEKLEGPFIDRNGQMNVTDPDKMREVLNRNRENLLQGIDDYLKIRNDIDIETDGRLDDDQIALLTQMKGKILSYERRSAEMADDILNHIGDAQTSREVLVNVINKEVERAKNNYEQKKKHWESVKSGKHSDDYKKKVEKELLAAEGKYKEAQNRKRRNEEGLKLLNGLLEEHESTAGERAAYAEGRSEGVIGRTAARMKLNQKRAINTDELQAILIKDPMNIQTLYDIVNSKSSQLDYPTRQRILGEIVDLADLAAKKLAYDKEVKKAIGDISYLNRISEEYKSKATQKELDNKSEELALNIQNANSMSDLDRIMREAYQMNPEIAKAAMDKAKQGADESTKKFIADYEKATKFYGDFNIQVRKLDPNISSVISNTAANEWEKALQDGVDVYDKFIEGLNLSADELEKSGVPGAKEIADAMKKVLKDLDAARKSIATLKNPKKGTTDSAKNSVEGGGPESVSGEGAGLAGLNKKMAEKRAKKEEKKDDAAPAGATDTQDSLQKAAEQEVRANKKIDSIEKLSKVLKDRIQKYNEDNPDSPFTMNFEQLLQQITDEEIAADGTNLNASDLKDDGTDLGEDEEGSQRAEDMHNNLRVTFRSDHPTEFRIYDGRNILDYRIPYNPDTEQLKAVQQLLQNLKVYQFVDKNYLGYVMRAMQDKDEPLTVHLLRSTDDTINSDSTHPITFMAIKWNPQAENAIRRYGFNSGSDVNLSDEVKPVTINGEQYHIIGVMTLNGEVAQEVSEAFASLQGALNQELNPQIEQAKENGEPFVVSKKTTIIDNIYTGRLEKKNNENDGGAKVSLYDFMTFNQEDQKNPATQSRRTSTEWNSGMEFYFGTVVNGMPNTIEDDKITDTMELPNDGWMEKNNGAIVLFVPKADGRLYPIRCSRRTVREWLDSPDADGGRSGRQLLGALLHPDPEHPLKNEYLGNILNYLRTVFDEEATLADKMNAKMMLQKYFIFGKESPLHFNDGEVTLTFDESKYNITSDTFEEFVQAFFDALGKANIMFTLPSPTIEYVSGRDVIKSGIFEIGLRGFYNFNANFTVQAIDGNGSRVTGSSDNGTDDHFTGGRNMRREYRDYDLGNGLKRYYITPDSTDSYYKVVDESGNPVSSDEEALINIIERTKSGTVPSYIESLLDLRTDMPQEVKKYLLDNVIGFDKIYYISDGDGEWLYDAQSPNHNDRERLIKLSSEKGVAITNKINQALSNFAQKPENLQEIMKLKKAGKSAPTEDGAPQKNGIVLGQTIWVPATESDKSTPGIKKLIKDGKLEVTVEGIHDDGSVDFYFNYSGGTVHGIVRKDLVSTMPPASSVPISASKKATPEAGKIFAGKTIDQLNPKNGGLEGLIAANKSNLSVKKVFEALQGAEDAGVPINYDKVNTDLQALLNADKTQVKQLRDALLHEIQGC